MAPESSDKTPAKKALALLSKIIEMEAELRACENDKAFQFFVVNRTQELLPYDRAVLAIGNPGFQKVQAISGISHSKPAAPFVRSLAKVSNWKSLEADAKECHVISGFPQELIREAEELHNALWLPLLLPSGRLIGGVWFFRRKSWSEQDQVIFSRWGEAVAHMWGYLHGGLEARPKGSRAKFGWGIAAVLVLGLFLPIRLSVLAPMEVAGRDAFMIAAPMQGVIEFVQATPNRAVRKGERLFSFDETELYAQYEIAQKSLEVAQERYRSAVQKSMQDPRAKAEIGLLKVQVEKQTAERDFRKSLYEKSHVTAPKAGVILFRDANDLRGLPVDIGQRVMELADPGSVEVVIYVSVADDLVVEEGAEVEVFLNRSPFRSLEAQVTQASYTAGEGPEGLSYLLRAKLTDSRDLPRIGARGVAKIYGDTTLVFLYLFRRPFAFLRQFLGL